MLILTHIGINIPDYVRFCLSQIRAWNPNYRIVFLVNEKNLENPIFSEFNVDTCSIESLHNNKIDDFINNFGRGNSFSHTTNVDYNSEDYWCVTSTRLFYIHEFCRLNNIENFFYFENDILIYEDLQSVENKITLCQNFLDCIFLTRITESTITTGFMYVSNNKTLSFLLDEISTYAKNKEVTDYLSEMSLLSLFAKKNKEKIIYFPPFYEGEYCSFFQNFDSIFDGASLGQYLDGTYYSPGSKQEIYGTLYDCVGNKDFSIEFLEEDGKKIPFMIIGSSKIKISNLHIHSKRLNIFLSN